ncbi:MAG: porin [Gammaproteobacteria bacterium]|nr:porin [Gammaproteobacteria bacterium]MCF6231347.1 porin [Gammaproteobacteria bacterium]
MKKTLSLLIGAVVAQGFVATAMADGPIDGTVYGKINTAIIMEDGEAAGSDDTYLSNWSSRLGFKGKTKLDGGLYVIYKLEYGISPDEKAENHDDDEDVRQIFKQRNAYIGLQGEFGKILAGTHDTPLKKTAGKIDMFDRLPQGDIKYVIVAQERINDLVHYTSPKIADSITVKVATQLQENGDGSNGTSFSATYDKGAIFAAIGVDSDVVGYDTTRLALQYKAKKYTAGVIYSMSEDATVANAESNDGFVVSGSYKIDAFKLKAQYGAGDGKKKDAKLMALGADYKLGEKTKLHGYLSSYEYYAANSKITTLGFGMEHNF